MADRFPEGSPDWHEAVSLDARMEEIVRLGRPLVEGTNLAVEGDPWQIGPAEVARAKELIRAVAPVTVETYRLHDHLRLTELVTTQILEAIDAEKAATLFQSAPLNPELVRVVALLHDFGRFITHRYGVTDVLGNNTLEVLGVHPEIIALMPDDRLRLVARTDTLGTLPESSEFLLSTAILEVADLMAKRDESGQLRSWVASLESPRKSRGKGGYAYQPNSPWKEEAEAGRRLQELVAGVSKLEWAIQRYDAFAGWLTGCGVDFEQVRQAIVESEQSSEVKAIIFDVGGVFVPDSDEKRIVEMAALLGTTPEALTLAWQLLASQLGTGAITEREFLESVCRACSGAMPDYHEGMLAQHLRHDYYRDVLELGDRLRARGYKVGILTDTCVPDAAARREDGIYDRFDFAVVSPEAGVRKSGHVRPGPQADWAQGDVTTSFKIAALAADESLPACVFIDDKEKYCANAKQAGMRAIHFAGSEGAAILEEQLEPFLAS